MSQWGNTDTTSNSVLWAVAQYNKEPNTVNRDLFFGNTTVSAFVNNAVAGQFGIDVVEAGVSSGNLAFGRLTYSGSGYGANGTVTITVTNGGTGGVANASVVGGRVTAINISTAGSGYITEPLATISAPAALNITANTAGVSNTNDTILLATANSKFLAGDRLYYGVPTNNTAIVGLVANAYYYVTFSNTTQLAVSSVLGGANANIAETRTIAETHTLTGDTATGVFIVGGAKNNGVTHAGWVIRTEGTGGRAGRINYETMVAMGSIGSDASDDNVLPDA